MSRSSALSKLKSVLQKSKESKQSQSQDDKTVVETDTTLAESSPNLQNASSEQANRLHRPAFMTVAALKAKNMAENPRSRSFKTFIEDSKQSETAESSALSISSLSNPIEITVDEDISDRSKKARESIKALLRDVFWTTPEGRSVKDTLHYRAEQEAIALVMEAKSKLYEDIKAGTVVIHERANCIDFSKESQSESPDENFPEGQKGEADTTNNINQKNNASLQSHVEMGAKASSPWAWGRGTAISSFHTSRDDDRREKRENALVRTRHREDNSRVSKQNKGFRDRDYDSFERDEALSRTHGSQQTCSDSEDDSSSDSQNPGAFGEFEERAWKKNDALVQTGNLSSRNSHRASMVKTVSMYDLRKKQQNFISITYERNLREFLDSHYNRKKT